MFLLAVIARRWSSTTSPCCCNRPPRRPRSKSAASAFPVITHAVPAIPLANDGPGRYRIVGVVAATGTDTKMFIHAETLANAKVKAELRGVVVTEIVKQ